VEVYERCKAERSTAISLLEKMPAGEENALSAVELAEHVGPPAARTRWCASTGRPTSSHASDWQSGRPVALIACPAERAGVP
jgi:hypothetical protein